MSQTLTAITTFPTTIVATSDNALYQNVSVLLNLDNRTILGISVLAKMYLLNTRASKNYLNNISQLRTDATTFLGSSPVDPGTPAQRWNEMQAAIDWNQAKQAGAAISTDVNTLVSNMGSLRETPEADLYMFYEYLSHRLSVSGY